MNDHERWHRDNDESATVIGCLVLLLFLGLSIFVVTHSIQVAAFVSWLFSCGGGGCGVS